MEQSHLRSRRRPASGRAEDSVGTKRNAQPMPPTSAKPSQRRALVVEADPVTLQLCRDVLESSGFVVDAVDSGIGAVVAAREGLPDVILMDLQLRDVPGGEAIGWLRSNPALRSTPIVVLTANADDDAISAATRPGASLRKPLSPLTIRRAIHEVLK